MTQRADHSFARLQSFDAQSDSWHLKYEAGSAASMVERVPAFCRAVGQPGGSNRRLLDFGCGSGHIGDALRNEGWRVIGADCAFGMLLSARTHSDLTETCLVSQRHTAMPFASGTFAVVIASSVLEYVSEVRPLLQDLRRVLEPGGRLIVTIPDVHTNVRKLEGLLAPCVRAIPISWRSLLPKRLRYYFAYLEMSRNRFQIRDWEDCLEGAGFRVMTGATGPTSSLTLLVASAIDDAPGSGNEV